MICIKTEIPQEICDIDDELKAIYHIEGRLSPTYQAQWRKQEITP